MKYKLQRVYIKLMETQPLYSAEPIDSPKAAVKAAGEEIRFLDRETVIVINLQTDKTPININTVSIGSLSSASVHPREIFKTAILSNAASIIMLHNHPSGNIKPSLEDLEITERIKSAGDIIGIELLDHIIIGRKGKDYSILKACEI